MTKELKKENLFNKILFIKLKFKKHLGYRMLLIEEKSFTKKDAFNWAEQAANECDGIITEFKII